jgi:hypothetical protein
MSQSCEAKKTPKSFKELMRSSLFWKPFLGIIIGGIGGFLYYYFVGCASGSCAITSSPYLSTIGGGLLGFFVLNSPCARC